MPETAVEVMKAALDQNCYLMLMVNERYIPDREVYGCFDRNHDIMVYGYDDEKQVFHTASFIFEIANGILIFRKFPITICQGN